MEYVLIGLAGYALIGIVLWAAVLTGSHIHHKDVGRDDIAFIFMWLFIMIIAWPVWLASVVAKRVKGTHELPG